MEEDPQARSRAIPQASRRGHEDRWAGDFAVGWRVEISDDPGEYNLYDGDRGTIIEVDPDPMRRDSTWMESRRVQFDTGGTPPRWFPKNVLKPLDLIELLASLAAR